MLGRERKEDDKKTHQSLRLLSRELGVEPGARRVWTSESADASVWQGRVGRAGWGGATSGLLVTDRRIDDGWAQSYKVLNPARSRVSHPYTQRWRGQGHCSVHPGGKRGPDREARPSFHSGTCTPGS